jgi:Glycosyltransferase 61
MASTLHQTRHGRREFQLGSFRVWSLGLSVYALVAILTATKVEHPKVGDDHSSRGRFLKDFMEGLSSLSTSASLKKQTSNASNDVIRDEPTRNKFKLKVEVTQYSQILALRKLAEAEAKAKSKALAQKADETQSQNGDNLSERKQGTAVSPVVEYINNFTFPAHGCLVNKVGERVHCHFHNLRINKTKISAGQRGGEPLDSVMGQDESMEYLSYQNGSFVLHAPLDPPAFPPSGSRHQYYYYYMNNVLQAVEYENTTRSTTNCDQVFVGLTLFITRYEYVNLYHTMTDWWNAYFSLPVDKRRIPGNNNTTKDVEEKVNVVSITSRANIEQIRNPRRIQHFSRETIRSRLNLMIVIALLFQLLLAPQVFIDAHPAGNLDPVWEELFGKVIFVRHLPFETTCFEEARFVPAGYSSPLFPRHRTISESEQQEAGAEFVQHVLNVYNLSHVRRIPRHVVVIERVPYISHPRSKPSQTQRLLGNIRELALNLPSFLSANVTVEVVTLVNETMRDQIAAIRRADVLVANHGAGLTHLLFLDANAHVVELSCNHGFFPELAKWRGRSDKIHHYCQPAPTDGGMNISTQYWHQHVVSVVRNAVLLGNDAETM